MRMGDFLDVVKEARDIAERNFRKVRVENFVYGVAGAGKTTAMLKMWNNNGRIGHIVAFNKRVKNEIIQKTKAKNDIFTFDGFFYRLAGVDGVLEPENERYFRLARKFGMNPLLGSEDLKYSNYIRGMKTMDVGILQRYSGFISQLLSIYERENKAAFELLPYIALATGGIDAFEEVLWVDEVQDIQPIHFLLFRGAIHGFGAGDQLVYQIFGARREYYLHLKQRAKNFQKLTTTWRVPKKIAEFVNSQRLGEFQMESKKDGGDVLRGAFSLSTVKRFLQGHGEKVVLVRSNWQKKKVREMLRAAGSLVAGVRDDLALLWEVKEHPETFPAAAEKMFFLQNLPYELQRGKMVYQGLLSGDSLWEELKKRLRPEYRQLLRHVEGGEKKKVVRLSTIHAFKGMEAEAVMVLYKRPLKARLLEERNVLYVAYTRAKRVLWLTHF